MSDPSARTFNSDFKRFFVRGLVVLLPTVLTLWIVVAAYQFVDKAIAEPINQGIRAAMANAAPYWEPLSGFVPDESEVRAAIAEAGPKPPSESVMRARLLSQNIHDWWTSRWYMNVIGLVVAIVAVYVAGRVLGGFLGRRVYRKAERIIISVPVIKQVYPSVKQIVDFLFGDDRETRFNRVVLVQYPSEGLWSVGFLTGAALKTVEATMGDSVTVFVPSSPTPFTGYAVCVRRNEVVELPISVEEAIRFIVSGGVLLPPHQQGAWPGQLHRPGTPELATASLPVSSSSIEKSVSAPLN